jgi:hypothetical protein
MSTQYIARIIYGFSALNIVSRDRKSGRVYLWEWLELNEIDESIQQQNAGLTDGGVPNVFIGWVVAEVFDYTRGTAWKKLDGLNVPEDIIRGVAEAHSLLTKQVPDEPPGEIGFYLLGEAQ